MKYLLVLFVVVLALLPIVSCSGKGSKLVGTTPSLDSQVGSTGTDGVNPDGLVPDERDDDYVAEDIAPPRDVFDTKLDRLNAPTNVAASDSTYNDKVVITWNHPSGTAPATYYIYRSETASNPSPTYLGGKTYPGTSFHDTTATPGTTYYYKLKSHKAGYNDSYFSTENSGKRSNRMNAPTGVTASDGLYNNKIAVTWNHPAGMTPLSYYIYRSTTASDPAPTFVGVKAYPNKSINDTTAVYGTTYYYKIKSHKVGYNDSYFSNEDSGYMNNRMTSPTGVAASDGTYLDKVRVTWSHPSQGVVPTTYYVYRSETADNPSPTYIGARSYPGTYYDDTTTAHGVTYYYKLKSHKSGYLDSYFSNENSGYAKGWLYEQVDTAGYAGQYTSLALDSNGYPHICFYDNSNLDLRYTYYDGDSWTTVTVADTGDVGMYATIALDTDYYPNISYYDNTNGDLEYSYYDGDSWETATVDSTDDVGKYSDLALDSSNNGHISYYDETNDVLRYAYYDGTDWLPETVDSHNQAGRSTSIAIDSSNYPHIAYYDGSYTTLRYASFDGTDWTIVTADSTANVGGDPSIALDSNDLPHVSHHKWDTDDLIYSYYNGATWENSVLDGATNAVGDDTSLAIDSNNRPYISYAGITDSNLMYAYFNGSKWVIEVVDEGGEDWVGTGTSLALDSNDYPRISYINVSDGYMQYAWLG